MKLRHPPRRRTVHGLTLIELTVLIAVTLSIAAVIYAGTRAWHQGRQRAAPAAVAPKPLESQPPLGPEFVIKPIFDQTASQQEGPGNGIYAAASITHLPLRDHASLTSSPATTKAPQTSLKVDW